MSNPNGCNCNNRCHRHGDGNHRREPKMGGLKVKKDDKPKLISDNGKKGEKAEKDKDWIDKLKEDETHLGFSEEREKLKKKRDKKSRRIGSGTGGHFILAHKPNPITLRFYNPLHR